MPGPEAKRALAAYLEAVPALTTIYGAFATAPILLLWVYLVWLVVLLGAVIAAYAPALQSGLARRPDSPAMRLELARSVLSQLEAARHSPAAGRSAAELALALRIDPLQLAPLLEQLQQLGWAGRLDETGPRQEPRWVLLCEPGLTPALPLLELIWLPPVARAPWRSKLALDKLSVADFIA
jgi:membrane protein